MTVCAAAVAVPAMSEPLRSITTVEWEHYFNMKKGYNYEDGYRINEVGIFSINASLSAVAKAEWKKATGRNVIKGMGGIVFDLFEYSYMETSYGVSIDTQDTQENTLAQHVLVDWYYDRGSYYTLLGTEAEFREAGMTVKPSAAVKWWLVPEFSVLGKYITSFDSDAGFNHSFWGEGAYRLHPKFSVKSGGTVGSYRADKSNPHNLEFSGLGGLSFLPRDGMRFSLEIKYLQRQEYSTISNTLVADIRF